ncbi:MAG: tetratricopeptide repeat protein [Terriglobia bacterium]
MLSRLLGFVMVGLVLPATPARSSDWDFLTAERHYRAKEFSQAEKLYAQVESGNTQYPVAQLRLGAIYYLTGRPEQAAKHLAMFLKFKKSPEAYCLLAGAQLNQGKYNQAANSDQQALQLDPKFDNAYTVQGMIHTAERDFPRADVAYHESLKLNYNNSDT